MLVDTDTIVEASNERQSAEHAAFLKYRTEVTELEEWYRALKHTLDLEYEEAIADLQKQFNALTAPYKNELDAAIKLLAQSSKKESGDGDK